MNVPETCSFAENRLLYPKDSTPPIDTSRLQLCFHTMSGYLMGSESQWKTNGASGVRSHFGIGGEFDGSVNDGRLVQWTNLQRQAYAQNGGNLYCWSVETSDGARNPIQPWTSKQQAQIVKLIVWFCSLTLQSRARLAVHPGEYGTITYHQEFAVFNTHNHDCPGAVRGGQLVALIARANAILAGGDTTVDATEVKQVENAVWQHDVKEGSEAYPAWRALRNAAEFSADTNARLGPLDTRLSAVEAKLDLIVSLLTPVPPEPTP